MDEDKIVLDRRSFEALAVDTRVKILKSLKARRKTLTEIAKEQGMSVSGIKEHLSVLEGVGLIEKKDDGHKWKYYELTKKGRDLVGPKEIRVLILLSMSIFTLLASMILMFWPAAQMAPAAAPADDAQLTRGAEMDAAYAAEMPLAAAAPPEESAKAAPEAANAMIEAGASEPAPPEEPAARQQDPSVPMIVALVSALTIFACLGILARNRMR